MIRHPPRSTLFPYPPLSHSLQNLPAVEFSCHSPALALTQHMLPYLLSHYDFAYSSPLSSMILSVWLSRSEEHTSELQSPCNLVCRLLLEKKKTTASNTLCCS